MNNPIKVSVPSRICLFGEHQDYLGLEVIAAAIDLKFSIKAVPRQDMLMQIKIRDERLNTLGNTNETGNMKAGIYEERSIDLLQPIVYEHNRDYLKSCINVVIKHGYNFSHGYDIVMDSQVPIGKGMSSSTVMVVCFMRFLLEAVQAKERLSEEMIVRLAFQAEVTEFNEPGGMMDHSCAVYGGLLHIDFSKGIDVKRLQSGVPGSFILFDSLERKNTTKVLADAKVPVVDAVRELNEKFGISSIRDFLKDETLLKHLDVLDETRKRKLMAAIDNHRLLRQALVLLTETAKNGKQLDMVEFGRLLKLHHANLRDGLGISTAKIESIFEEAYRNGALGGKINGSGGGGCGYVYVRDEDLDRVINAIRKLGFPAEVLKVSEGIQIEGGES